MVRNDLAVKRHQFCKVKRHQYRKF